MVSIVQNYFLAEKDGNDLPENLLTLKGKIVISEVGFKGAFISGLVSILLTPFFVGVIERSIPIFGSYEFTVFDQAFAVALTLSFALGYSLILASIGKFYIGRLSKRAINWLMCGLTMAGILKIIIAFILYNTLYASVLEEGTGGPVPPLVPSPGELCFLEQDLRVPHEREAGAPHLGELRDPHHLPHDHRALALHRSGIQEDEEDDRAGTHMAIEVI